MGANFFFYYNAFVFVNILILFSILVFRKNNSRTNILLGLIILCPGLNFLNNMIIISEVIYRFPVSLFLFQGTALTYGFLIYMYVISMIGKPFSPRNILHYITLFAILLDIFFYVEFLNMLPEQQKHYLDCLFVKECYPSQMNIINALAVIVWMAYFIQSHLIVLKHEKSAQNFFSDIDKINITYLKNFTRLIIGLNSILIVLYLTIQTSFVEYFVIPTIVNVVNTFILFYAFHRNAIFNQQQYCTLLNNAESLSRFQKIEDPLCKDIQILQQEKQKTQKEYILLKAEIEELSSKIEKLLKEKKPHLHKDINLTKFSAELNSCSYTVSLFLNTKYNMNFFDFINYHRIQEVLHKLKNNDLKVVTIEGIASECGFNSKSAFYRAFKKFTGKTPTEYLKENFS